MDSSSTEAKKRKTSPEPNNYEVTSEDCFPFGDLPQSATAHILAAAGLNPFLRAAPSLGRQALSASEAWGTIDDPTDLQRLGWTVKKSKGTRQQVPPGSLTWTLGPGHEAFGGSQRFIDDLGAPSLLVHLVSAGCIQGLALEGYWACQTHSAFELESYILPYLAPALTRLDLTSVNGELRCPIHLFGPRGRAFAKLSDLTLPLYVDTPGYAELLPSAVSTLPSLQHLSFGRPTFIREGHWNEDREFSPALMEPIIAVLHDTLSTPPLLDGVLRALDRVAPFLDLLEGIGISLARGLSHCILTQESQATTTTLALQCMATAFLYPTRLTSQAPTRIAASLRTSGALGRVLKYAADPFGPRGFRLLAARAVSRVVQLVSVPVFAGLFGVEGPDADHLRITELQASSDLAVNVMEPLLRSSADRDRFTVVVEFCRPLRPYVPARLSQALLCHCYDELTAMLGSKGLEHSSREDISALADVLFAHSVERARDSHEVLRLNAIAPADESLVTPAILHLLTTPGMAALPSSGLLPDHALGIICLYERLALLLGPAFSPSEREAVARHMLERAPALSLLGDRWSDLALRAPSLMEIVEGIFRVAGETEDSALRGALFGRLRGLYSLQAVTPDVARFRRASDSRVDWFFVGALVWMIVDPAKIAAEFKTDSKSLWKNSLVPVHPRSRTMALVCLSDLLLQNTPFPSDPFSSTHNARRPFIMYPDLLFFRVLAELHSEPILTFLLTLSRNDAEALALEAGLAPALLHEARLVCLAATACVIPPEALPPPEPLPQLVSAVVELASSNSSTAEPPLTPPTVPSDPSGKSFRRSGPFPTVRLALSVVALDLCVSLKASRDILLSDNGSLLLKALPMCQALTWDSGMHVVCKTVQFLLQQDPSAVFPLARGFFFEPVFLRLMPFADRLGGPYDISNALSEEAGPLSQEELAPYQNISASTCAALALIDLASSDESNPDGLKALLSSDQRAPFGSPPHLAAISAIFSASDSAPGAGSPQPNALLSHLVRLSFHTAERNFAPILKTLTGKRRQTLEGIYPLVARLLLRNFVYDPTDAGRDAVAFAYGRFLAVRARGPSMSIIGDLDYHVAVIRDPATTPSMHGGSIFNLYKDPAMQKVLGLSPKLAKRASLIPGLDDSGPEGWPEDLVRELPGEIRSGCMRHLVKASGCGCLVEGLLFRL